jgi:hypothetical protein
MQYRPFISSYFIKSFSALCLCLVLNHNATAQKIRLGLTAAPMVSWLKSNSENLNTSDNRFAFSYGVITDFGFAENYAIGSGVNVTYKGGMFTDNSLTPPVVTRTYLQFIEIPFTLKMKTNQIGLFRYYGQFGLSGNMNIKAKGDVTVLGIEKKNADISSSINTFGLSMILGLGAEFPVNGNTAFFGGVTFNNGITDIINSNEKAIANYLALNLGVLF